MNSYVIGIISLGLFFSLFFLIEKITPSRMNKEFTRKIAHILAGLFAVLIALILESSAFLLLSTIPVIIMLLAYRVRLFTFIHNVGRSTIGEILFPVGVIASYLIAGPTTVFYASILILTFADTMGSLAFRFSKKLPYCNSIVFFLVALIILGAFYGFQPNIIAIVFLVTIIEKFSPYGSDNLSIPVSSVLLIRLLL